MSNRLFVIWMVSVTALSLWIGWGIHEDAKWERTMKARGCYEQSYQDYYYSEYHDTAEEVWLCEDGSVVYRP